MNDCSTVQQSGFAAPGGLPLKALHAETARAARAALPGPEALAALGDFFKLIADRTRLGILHALGPGELCVRDLGAALGMSESAVSHQLALLRRARMVRARRAGREVHYGLRDRHVRQLVDAARVHLAEVRRAP